MNRLYLIVALASMSSTLILSQQDVEVSGHLKLSELDTVINSDYFFTQQSNGKLAVVSPQRLQPEYPKPLELSAGLENYGAGYQDAMYYKFEDKVYIDGLIEKSSGNFATGDILFVLPKEYRPNGRIILHAKFQSQRVRLNVEVDGSVEIISGPSGVSWLSLDGLWFYRPISIGSYDEGGIVFYIADPPIDLDGDGLPDNGLIVAEENLIDEVEWGCYGTDVGDQGNGSLALGEGYSNTMDIINACAEPNYAAKNCTDLNLNGYTDWFLPSVDEFVELNNAVGYGGSGSNQNLAELVSGFYWTSTETSAFTARGYSPTQFNSQIYSKISERKIRPIRVF